MAGVAPKVAPPSKLENIPATLPARTVECPDSHSSHGITSIEMTRVAAGRIFAVNVVPPSVLLRSPPSAPA
jgi:hypothetical protein